MIWPTRVSLGEYICVTQYLTSVYLIHFNLTAGVHEAPQKIPAANRRVLGARSKEGCMCLTSQQIPRDFVFLLDVGTPIWRDSTELLFKESSTLKTSDMKAFSIHNLCMRKSTNEELLEPIQGQMIHQHLGQERGRKMCISRHTIVS